MWLFLILLMPFAVMVLGFYLIRNGVTMWRREGRSLGNMLSLVAGVLVFALPVIAVALVRTTNPVALGLAFLLFFVSSYVGGVFVVFLVYALAYARMEPRFEPDAVVILGSRLIGGKVPPLLRARLDRAVQIYGETDPKPLMIPSGGQGADETRPEGAAMAEYLVQAGIPEGDVLPENHAVNTAQNLRLARDIQLQAGRTGPLVAVTNDYHVLRSALIGRKLDLDAEVQGARTASYYRPSAFLREFVAVLSEHKVLNALACLPFLGISILVMLYAFSAQ
ncbi:YdcF family protein [Galactobacter caseinivorans]|uniref:YdcF family protein n=1 Tax=Galactobacter caseinivorans TaxID=2676123 RepID=A0A496PHS1_9MICC|nr:YdcF family protein [Galactobacter caseinivorans]